MFKKYYITSILLITTLCISAQKVQVEQRLGAIQIMMGDTTSLTLTVTAPKGAKVVFPEYNNPLDDGNPISPRQPLLEVLEKLSGDTTTLDDGYIRTSMKYAITSYDPDIYTIDSLMISVDGKSYCGNKLALKVLEMPIDTTNVQKMAGPKGIMDNDFMMAEWYPVIFSFIVTLLLLAAIWWMVRRKRQGKPIHLRFRTIKHIPPHEKALAEIDTIKKEQLAVKEDNKAYYTRLTDALRKYMEERFGFSAMEMTTSEIIEQLRKEQDSAKIEELRMLFETADLAKFAKYQTLINENDRNLANALDFINSTKKEEDKTTETKQQEKLSQEDEKMLKTTQILKALIIAAGCAAAVIFCMALWRIIQLLE